jgi:hypothetical protein
MSPYGGRGWPAHCRFSRMLRTTVTLCVLWAPLACRSVPRERANPTCTGDEFLAVRNETGELVEVYMVRPGSRVSLGTAGAGRTEFTLPPGTARGSGFQGRRSNGDWVFGARGRQLTFVVECAQGDERSD